MRERRSTPQTDDSGWLCKLKVSDKGALEGLLDEKAYRSFCEGEDQKH